MGFLDKIQSRLEVYRLEQRYTRNRHRRSHFISNAMYVDGEYVYEQTTGSSTSTSSSTSSAATSKNSSAATTPAVEMPMPLPPTGNKRYSVAAAASASSSSYYHGSQQYHGHSQDEREERRPDMGYRSHTQAYRSGPEAAELPERKKLHRFSSMPGMFKSSSKTSSSPRW